MMTNTHGVCPKRAAPHKGCSDFVQQAEPNYASQLRGSNADAQILRNQLILSKTCAAGIRETKLGDSPSLKTLMKASSRCTPGAQKEKDNAANVALWDDCFLNQKLYQYIAGPQDRHYESFVGQPSGDSLAFFRCRRLISPIAALTKKAAVLSLSSFTNSISCSTSCGTLTFTCFDLLFIEPVAISGLLGNRCDSVYAKKSCSMLGMLFT